MGNPSIYALLDIHNTALVWWNNLQDTSVHTGYTEDKQLASALTPLTDLDPLILPYCPPVVPILEL
jgi:hypothetical protein